MNNEILERHLVAMKAGFRSIHSLTMQLGDEPVQEAIDKAVSDRAALLGAIQRERDALNTIDSGWLSKVENDGKLSALMAEVQEMVRKIGAADERMVDLLERRKLQNRRELHGLYHRSRAAGAYTLQTRV